MNYLVEILVRKKEGVLNPEAKIIGGAIINLGYEIEDFKTGKYFSYMSKKKSIPEVKKEADNLCKSLLANVIVEQSEIISIKEQAKKKMEKAREDLKEKIGKLEKVERLFGMGKDIRIVVDGEEFYKTYWKGDRLSIRKNYYEKLQIYKNKQINVKFKKINVPINEWALEKVVFWLCGSLGIPKKHNEIKSISYEGRKINL